MTARKGSKSNGNVASKKVAPNIITERKSKSKGSKPMKQIFRRKIFSFSGDFGENWAHEQMADWIKAHGGQYEREVSANTTHLICTVEHYKKKTDQGMSP
jgi:NAD-dependent DNA ligase